MAKKRSSGEGSVWKLKSGSWRGQLMDGYREDGKKNIISFSADTKAEVLEQIRAYQNHQDSNIHIDTKITAGSWGDLWYRDYQSQVQASTYSSYRYTLQIIKKYLGDQPLCKILPIHINQMMDNLVNEGYSLSQIHKCRTMLIQIFDSAEDNGLCANNPARKSKIIRDRDGILSRPRYLKDAFNEEEVQLLRQELPNDLLGNSIRLMLDSGLRVQELIALAPEDIAQDGSSVDVNKAIKMVGDIPTLGPPKSKRSRRLIPIPMESRSCAIYLREHGGKTLIWGLAGRNPFYSVRAFRRRYTTALKKIDGVRLLSPHCCRHTYVTRLQAKGVPMETIARLVGHSSIATTGDYTHIASETLQAAVARLDEPNNVKESGKA